MRFLILLVTVLAQVYLTMRLFHVPFAILVPIRASRVRSSAESKDALNIQGPGSTPGGPADRVRPWTFPAR